MTITITTLVERGYTEPSTWSRWPIASAYRWTGLGRDTCSNRVSPERYVDLINAGLKRHCIHCYRSMVYKKAAEKDPFNTWRTVCRPCFAQGFRLESHRGAAQEIPELGHEPGVHP